jgi:hypothetical protein
MKTPKGLKIEGYNYKIIFPYAFNEELRCQDMYLIGLKVI